MLAPYEKYVSRPLDQVARDLESFASLLLRWNRVQNLVSRETDSSAIWARHIDDSLQILPLLRPNDHIVLDLGSGGGFPAVPVAIAARGRLAFILTEPIGKKAAFLRAASRELGLDLRVEARRVETITPDELPAVDVVTSRALAPLTRLLELAAPFFSPKTRAILLKGREHVEELAESRALWHSDVIVHPSRTEAGAAMLEISNLDRRHK